MSNASDKARFYLEQQVPELKEFERKKIFTKDEIHSITTKRSSFEHKINAAGPTPADFARYAEYEMNLDTLRLKRVKRLGIKAPTYTGQRRVMFILDRAVRKLPGDLALWMQYIEYARRCKAYKKLESLFLKALRLHPMKAELWMYAARYTLEEHADMTAARAYMQRGLRFCKSRREMWVGYGKLEMIYVSKIWARQRILGLGSARKTETEGVAMSAEDEKDADMLKLPTLTEEDINPSLDEHDERDDKIALETLNNTPVLSGAIPIAVYEAALKQFSPDQNASFARDYFLMISQFKTTPCTEKILTHIFDSLMSAAPASPLTHISYVSMPIILLEPTQAAFPRACGELVKRLRQCEENYPAATMDLNKELVKVLKPVLNTKELDPALRKVVESVVAKAEREAGLQG
ncbi:U3 snoRNP protein [Ascosphaera pollenicola]|nr:U3 snoRNP protein [Ascosphaera pollenicola]